VLFVDSISNICHNTYALPLHSHLAVASGYFDFSVSGFVCQVRLPRWLVARHKGIRNILLTLFVEKMGES